MYFATRTVSSLEKVFCCPELPGERLDRISGAQGERVAFQLACRADSNLILEIECSSPFGEGVSLREVGLVPCTQPAMPDDPYVLTHRPGLFPVRCFRWKTTGFVFRATTGMLSGARSAFRPIWNPASMRSRSGSPRRRTC